MSLSALEELIKVARSFKELEEPVVLVGGYAAFLLIEPRHRSTLRTTEDVDYVFQASNRVDFYHMAERMRVLGFSECADQGAPICRWVVDGVLVDVMPCSEEALGFSNRWYPLAMQEPLIVELEPELPIAVARPLVYLGTKFEALNNRGDNSDLIGNTDLEDIVTVIAYGNEVLPELDSIDPALRAYLQEQATRLLSRDRIEELVSGCLSGDSQSQACVPRVLEALRVMSTGLVIYLSQEHLEFLNRPSLLSGKGGHQDYFRELSRQRSGNRQPISLNQVQQARKRLAALRGAGTWQAAYSAVLQYFGEEYRDL